MKSFSVAMLVGLAVALNGCAFLTAKGVIEPGDAQALCADVATACSAAELIDADEDVRKACSALIAVCLAAPK